MFNSIIDRCSWLDLDKAKLKMLKTIHID